jgi:hypothetical protein
MRVQELLLEIAPGELKAVGDCNEIDLVSAGLRLLLSTEPDYYWEIDLLLWEIAMEAMFPAPPESPEDRWARAMDLMIAAVGRYPFPLHHDLINKLRLGLEP